MALTWKEAGLILGACHLFKGVSRFFDEVDKMMGKTASPPHERPSTWLNVGLGALFVALPRLVRVPRTLDWLLTAGGASLTVKVWEYIEEYATTAGATLRVTPTSPTTFAPARVETTQVTPTSPAPAKVEAQAPYQLL